MIWKVIYLTDNATDGWSFDFDSLEKAIAFIEQTMINYPTLQFRVQRTHK